MTVTNNVPSGPGSDVEVAVDLITVVIDGVEMRVPKGTLVIRAAEQLGIEVPRFCDHPLLEPVAACRACLIEVEGMPKPQPACAQVLSEGMQVHTQYSSEVARLAQEGVMEFLLLNHPLDCPVCDKGGECPLQNQAMSVGRPESRFDGVKREFEKPINVSAQVLLDRERCVSCARCTRFAEQIAGDPMIELLERGAKQQVGTAADEPFDSYFSGNTVQICPVGALTSASYRFRSRPFDLVSVPTTCEHCASGCSLRTDYRRGVVTRRLAWDDAEVNEEWNCDKGRFAFSYLTQGRIESPMIRENGELRVASWPEAIDVAARGLAAAARQRRRPRRRPQHRRGRLRLRALRSRRARHRQHRLPVAHVLGGGVGLPRRGRRGRARQRVLRRPRVGADRPARRLRARGRVAHRLPAPAQGGPLRHPRGVGRRRRDQGPGEDRRPARRRRDPGEEARALGSLDDETRALLAQPGAVILVGERVAGSAGAASAALTLASETGAALAWVPRRAGERGALDAGRPRRAAARRPPADRPRCPRRGRCGMGHRPRRPAGLGRTVRTGPPRRRQPR